VQELVAGLRSDDSSSLPPALEADPLDDTDWGNVGPSDVPCFPLTSSDLPPFRDVDTPLISHSRPATATPDTDTDLISSGMGGGGSCSSKDLGEPEDHDMDSFEDVPDS